MSTDLVEFNYFVIFAISASLYIVCKKRPLDFTTLALTSFFVYFSPLFLGQASIESYAYSSDIHPTTYWLVTGIGICLLSTCMIFDFFINHENKTVPFSAQPDDQKLGYCYLALAGFFILTAIAATRGRILYSNDKALILSMLKAYCLLYQPAAMLSYFYFFRCQNRLGMALSLGVALVDTYFGFRLTLACIFIITFIGLFQFRQIRIITQWRLVLGSLAALIFLLSYKQLYQNIKLGQFDIVFDKISSGNLFQKSMNQSEPFVVVSSLNEIIQTDFSVPMQYLKHLAIVAFPMGRSITGIEHPGFNFYFQELLFPSINSGMAGTFWGELYAISGLLAVFSIAILWSILINTGSSFLRTSSSQHLSSLLFVFFVYFSFYIFRNDIAFQISLSRDLCIIWFLGIVLFRSARYVKIL